MFYKHWQKLALALTGFFWFACDSDTTSANGAEEPPVNSSDSIVPQSSDSVVPQSSDAVNSSETANSSETVNSSESTDPNRNLSSAEEQNSSSSFTKIMPAYGVEIDFSSSSTVTPESSSSFGHEVMPLYGVQVDRYTCTQLAESSKVECEDGITCEQTTTESWKSEYECIDDICPDYGVVNITEKTYKCSDGKTYSEAEFLARYNVLTREEVPLYGAPSFYKK